MKSFKRIIYVQGTKIHASVKKVHINRFERQMVPGEWRTIKNFTLSYAYGQFKPTNHRYKMGFMNQTIVTRMDPLSDSQFLTLTPFNAVLHGGLNPNFLIGNAYTFFLQITNIVLTDSYS